MRNITRQRRTECMMCKSMSMGTSMMCRNMVIFGVRFLPDLSRPLCSKE